MNRRNRDPVSMAPFEVAIVEQKTEQRWKSKTNERNELACSASLLASLDSSREMKDEKKETR